MRKKGITENWTKTIIPTRDTGLNHIIISYPEFWSLCSKHIIIINLIEQVPILSGPYHMLVCLL